MLAAHYVAGDGRVNENIALTAIHQVFHSEHDRLVAQIQQVLQADTSATGVAALAQWRSATGTPDGWNGERLFQAARFINEMEYQHAVFEEFARKVQPAVHPFHVYSPTWTRRRWPSSRTRSTGSGTRCSTTRSPGCCPTAPTARCRW